MWTFHEEFTADAQTERSHARRESGWFMAGLVALAIAMAALTAVRARADEKTSPNLVPAGAKAQLAAATRISGWSSVIVQSKEDMSAADESSIRRLGGYIYRRLPLIEAAAVRIPTRNLGRLSALPFVSRVSKDDTVVKEDEFTVGSSGAGVAFDQFGLTGDGVTVAVVDSGIDNHKDLSGQGGSRILQRVNFVSASDTKDDLCGHGTHVAGVIAGDGSASSGPKFYRTFYGIARSANLVSVRVLDEQGKSDVSTVIKGIQWVVDNRSVYNIRVLNLSLGHPATESWTTDPFCKAVEQAWKSGIVVVCAAGNLGRLHDTASADLQQGLRLSAHPRAPASRLDNAGELHERTSARRPMSRLHCMPSKRMRSTAS